MKFSRIWEKRKWWNHFEIRNSVLCTFSIGKWGLSIVKAKRDDWLASFSPTAIVLSLTFVVLKGSLFLSFLPHSMTNKGSWVHHPYRKDIQHLYHAFVYSHASFLSSIYSLPAMHSVLVTLYVMEYLIGINQRLI